MKNIILIGLPGAGKSTLGVILAKTLGMRFIDTDIRIQERCGMLLQEIIDRRGTEGFLGIEEETILSLNEDQAVIATGGSVVYSSRAMDHLKAGGTVVYLVLSYPEMVRRLQNIRTRGAVLARGQSLREMYDQRIPLYEAYADIRVQTRSGRLEDAVTRIADITRKSG